MNAIDHLKMLERFESMEAMADFSALVMVRPRVDAPKSRVCLSCGSHQSDDGTLPCDH